MIVGCNSGKKKADTQEQVVVKTVTTTKNELTTHHIQTPWQHQQNE